MSLKSLTRKIPFWEISLVTLFFFTGYGVSVYKQSNLTAHEKTASNNAPSLVDGDMDLDLNQFLAGLEEAEWSDAALEPIPPKYKDTHLKRKKQARTLKKYQATHPKTKEPMKTPPKKGKVQQHLDDHSPLASQPREPLFDTQNLDAIPNEHLTGHLDLESKEQLESLFTLSDGSENFDALVPSENSENKPSVPLKKEHAKKLKKKKKKIKNSSTPQEASALQEDSEIENRMADSTPVPDTFMGSWGEKEEDSFALAMNDSPQDTGEKWNDASHDQTDWFMSAAQSQTPENGTNTQPISDFIGESTSIESTIKAFSNQNQTEENSEGLQGRAFDQDEYEYLTNQGFDENGNRDFSKQATWSETLSTIEGSQFGPEMDQNQKGYDYFQNEQGAAQAYSNDFAPYNPSEEYSTLTEFGQDADYPPEIRAELLGENCKQVASSVTPIPLARPLPLRPRAYGRIIRRLPPPPPGVRAPYPRGSRPVAYRMLPPPPRPYWR